MTIEHVKKLLIVCLMMCVVTWRFISQVTTLLLLSTLLYHDEQTPFFHEIENLFDKIISVNGFIKKNHTTL